MANPFDQFDTPKTGNPFDQFDKPQVEKPTVGQQYKAGGKAAFEELGGAAGGYAGAELGAGLGAMTGPFAPVAIPAGAIIGGLGGYYAGSKAQQGAGQLVPQSVKEATGFSPEQRAEERKKMKTATAIGKYTPDVIAVAPSAYQLGQFGITKAGELGEKLAMLTGKKSQEATGGLKSAATSEATTAQTALQKEAQERTKGRAPEVESQQAISDVKFQTRQKVQQQLKQAKDAEQTSLNQLSTKPVADEDLGLLIQNKGSTNVKNIQTNTETEAIKKLKEPAFERSRTRQDNLNTNSNSAPVMSKINAEMNTIIARTPDRFKGDLINLQKDLKKPMTLDQAEYWRRWLADPILHKDSGFASLGAVQKSKIGDLVKDAMTKYEPDVAKYIERYKTGKESERIALGGRGEGLISEVEARTETPIFAGKPTQAVNYYLDGTKDSADKLLKLVGGKSPELDVALKGNIRSKMEKLNSDEAQKFINNNEGLFKTFPELKPLADSVVKSKSETERLSRMAETSQSRLAESLKTTTNIKDVVKKSATEKAKLSGEIKDKLTVLKNASGPESVTLSKDLIGKLRKERLISPEQYEKYINQIREAESIAKDTSDLRKRVSYIAAAAAIGSGLTTTGYYKLKAVLGL